MTHEAANQQQVSHEISSCDFSEKSPLKRLLGSLYGFDFFISYAWGDARDYAVELAESLPTSGMAAAGENTPSADRRC